MKISFFKENEYLNEKAIGAGVYIFKIGKNGGGKEEFRALYIGRSYSMAARCTTHLYELYKEPSYFGLIKENFSNDNLEIKVEIYKPFAQSEGLSNGDRDIILDEIELKAIKELEPLSQLKTSDRLHKDRIKIVQSFINGI